ncbi:hypothetical protein E2320_010883 [Naja naja]|nr:hypothetical protein E2320_010883 [Naja naja]
MDNHSLGLCHSEPGGPSRDEKPDEQLRGSVRLAVLFGGGLSGDVIFIPLVSDSGHCHQTPAVRKFQFLTMFCSVSHSTAGVIFPPNFQDGTLPYSYQLCLSSESRKNEFTFLAPNIHVAENVLCGGKTEVPLSSNGGSNLHLEVENNGKQQSELQFYLVLALTLISFLFLLTVTLVIMMKLRQSNLKFLPCFAPIPHSSNAIIFPPNYEEGTIPYSYQLCLSSESKIHEITFPTPKVQAAEYISCNQNSDVLLPTNGANVEFRDGEKQRKEQITNAKQACETGRSQTLRRNESLSYCSPFG